MKAAKFYWFLYICCWLKNTPLKVNKRVVLSRKTNCAGIFIQQGSPVLSIPIYSDLSGILKNASVVMSVLSCVVAL